MNIGIENLKDENIFFDKIIKDGAKNGTLIIPKELEVINKNFGKKVLESGIKKIQFEKGSRLQEIYAQSFLGNANLVEIDFSNCTALEVLEELAFCECLNLNKITFPKQNNINYINYKTFSQTAIEELDLSNSIIYGINTFAFANCQKLKNVKFNNCENLREINDFAFKGCINLENIDFTNSGVEIIGSGCFKNTHLKKVDFSNTPITKVRDMAFFNCPDLKEVIFKNCTKLFSLNEQFLGMCHLDLLDLSGCDDLKIIKTNSIDCKTLKISANIIGLQSDAFSDVFNENAEVEVYDKGALTTRFKAGDSGFRDLFIMNLCKYLYAKNLGVNSGNIINHTQNQFEILNVVQNKEQFDNIISAFKEKGIDENKACNLLSKLCCFGLLPSEIYNDKNFYDKFKQFSVYPEKITKSEINVYKNLLAKDLLNHKITQDIKSTLNKDFINELLQQKINKIARSLSLTQLIIEFVKNNILPHPDCKKIVDELSNAENFTVPNIGFAEFFVYNFNELVKQKIHNIHIDNSSDKEFVGIGAGKIRLCDIYNNFDRILNSSNKLVVTRNDKQRLKIADCEYSNIYNNVEEKYKRLAEVCGCARITQDEFEELKNIYDTALKIKDKQILKVGKDDANYPIKYQFIEKDNPIGFVLGNITNCCQCCGEMGFSCVANGMLDVNSGFIAFLQNEKIIGQAWVWYSKKQKAIALDNIEMPHIYLKEINSKHNDEFLDCIKRLTSSLVAEMEKNGHKIEKVVLGKGFTDLEMNSAFPLEKRTRKMVTCDREYEDEPCYSDVSSFGQYVLFNATETTQNKFMQKNNKQNIIK